MTPRGVRPSRSGWSAKGFAPSCSRAPTGSCRRSSFNRPDVIVLDINLPGVSGLDVLGGLARRWPKLPVIIMTAFGGRAVGADARRLGAAAYLEKPFRMGTLVDEIRRAAVSDGVEPPGAE